MAQSSLSALSRRERQIMEIVYRLGSASVADVLAALPDPPSYSAVRGMLRLLEDKGHVKHREDGRRFIYLPTVPRDRARRSALRSLLQTFFGGSTTAAMASLLELDKENISDEDLARLSRLIAQARKEGR